MKIEDRGVRVKGHRADGNGCVCGWVGDGTTKRTRIAAYTAHLTDARANRQRECRDCHEHFDLSRMSKSRPTLCKPCMTERTKAWARAHPDEWERHRRRSYLKRKYNITPEDFDRMLEEQGGVCAVCRRPPSDPRGWRMHVDHDHTTGKVRGVLCYGCNSGMGNFGDDIDRLLAAIEYLRRAA